MYRAVRKFSSCFFMKVRQRLRLQEQTHLRSSSWSYDAAAPVMEALSKHRAQIFPKLRNLATLLPFYLLMHLRK